MMVCKVMCVLLVIWLPHDVFPQSINKRCLHKGCEMSSGLYNEELNVTINLLLAEDELEYKDNILRIASWDINVDQETRKQENLITRMRKVCNYIQIMQPTILGLQHVLNEEVAVLKSCLGSHKVITGEPSLVDGAVIYNPLIIKSSRRLTLVDTGSFWVGRGPNNVELMVNGTTRPITCTWARLRVAIRKSRYPKYYQTRSIQNEPFGNLLLRLFKLFIRQKDDTDVENRRQQNIQDLRKSMKEQPKVMYNWIDFYVAVAKFDQENDHIAKKQAHLLTKHLRNEIMDRRRYPVFLMGDFGFEDNSKMYDYLDNVHWLKNTMDQSRHQYPSLTCPKKGLVDYIWFDQFKSIMAATLTDTVNKQGKLSDHHPVFAALLTEV